MEVWGEKSVDRLRTDTRVVGPPVVARVTGERLMVDQNEIAVVWVTREAQAKADHRLGQLLERLPE